MTAKRHHFNPILHIRRFVGDAPKGQVWTYDKREGHVRPAKPANTAVQAHFYSFERDDGTMDTTMEDCVSKIESDAAPVYEALLQGKTPDDPQARADFALFLALMYVRTPTMRRMAAEMQGRGLQTFGYAHVANPKAFDSLVRRIEQEGGPSFDAEQKERVRQVLLNPSNFVMEVSGQHMLPIVLGAIDKLTPILFAMKWSIVRPVGGFYITSDNPMVRVVDVDPKTRHQDGGFLNKTARVIYPLSPDRLLFMSWNHHAPEVDFYAPQGVTDVNRALAAHADRYLYAHIKDDKLSQLAAEFRDTRLAMTTQGSVPKNLQKSK